MFSIHCCDKHISSHYPSNNGNAIPFIKGIATGKQESKTSSEPPTDQIAQLQLSEADEKNYQEIQIVGSFVAILANLT